MTFGSVDSPTQVFWSNGSAWGTCTRTPNDGAIAVELNVLHGSLGLQRLAIEGAGMLELETPILIKAGESKTFEIQ